MVLSNRVYSTQNPRRQFVPRTQKDYLENHILKKRNEERDRLEYWNGTCKYYDRVEKQNTKFHDLVSEQSKRTSLDAFLKKDDKSKNKEELENRRDRLRNLIQTEKLQYEAELKLIPKDTQDIKDLREIREMFRKEKEEEHRKEAELRMLQHWKINNPQIRQVESVRNERLAQKYLDIQIKERKELEARKEREEEELERQAEMRRRVEEESALRAEEERRVRLDEWRRELDSQLEELRRREREGHELERRRFEEEEMQREAEKMREETKKLEKKNESREIKSYQKKQHSLQLRARAEIVEANLQQDRKRIDKMLRLVELQESWERKEKEKCLKEVKWMQEVLEYQKNEETRRRKEMELLFAEEAAKMWNKQEDVWDREDRARKRLMEEVSDAWNKQIQERVKAAQDAEKLAAQEKSQVESRIQELKHFIQEDETKKIKKRENLVQGFDEGIRAAEQKRRQVRFQEQAEESKQRQEEIREEARLARYLTQSLQVQDDQQDPPVQDFRRRKVRWYY